tara:strand:- start:341 stop:520 length:180 start_codon:yes stop_codon:yes gene_type:complete
MYELAFKSGGSIEITQDEFNAIAYNMSVAGVKTSSFTRDGGDVYLLVSLDDIKYIKKKD